MTVSEYVAELLATPEPVMTEQGRAVLARAVLAIKLAHGADRLGPASLILTDEPALAD